MLAQGDGTPPIRVAILNVLPLLVTGRRYYLPIVLLSVRTLSAAILTPPEGYPEKI
jgi:hypothetical protein